MFVISVKSSAIKTVVLCAFLAGCAALGIYAAGRSVAVSGRVQAALSYRAASAQERVEFLSQFGWEVDEDPVEVSEIIIPAEFDKAYEEYNEIQKQHGLDLSDYCGRRAKRWTYNVKNFPGFESGNLVQANIFIVDGTVIGGDICSLEKDGFMQSFYYPETITTEADTTA